MSIFEVTGNEGSESLLTCGVPQLKPVIFGLVSDIFGQKIDSDCRLDHIHLTLADYSKRSWIYFSMMLDFPTDWPPKNTILILVFPVTVLLIEWFIIQTFIIYLIETHQLISPPKMITTPPTWSKLNNDFRLATCHFLTNLYKDGDCSHKNKEIYKRFCGEYDLCQEFWSHLCQILYFYGRNKLPPMVFWDHTVPWGQAKIMLSLLKDLLWISWICSELDFFMDWVRPHRCLTIAGNKVIPIWEV